MKRRSDLQRERTAAALLVGAAAVGVFGCNRSGEQPVPAPKASQASAVDAPAPGVPDTTPKAGDVLKAPAAPAQTSTNAQRTDASHELTKQEEATAMPMPGQANDHSTLAKDSATR
jgi:hypothetical protein